MSTISLPDEVKPQYFNDLAHTLGIRRTHHLWRTFVVAQASDNWIALPDKFAHPSRSLSSPNMAMVFSGVSLISIIICYPQNTLTNRSKERNGMQWAVSC